jgi:hypothetical protein
MFTNIKGGVDLLHVVGNQGADMSQNPDMDFNHFIELVDCMVMGRYCFYILPPTANT